MLLNFFLHTLYSKGDVYNYFFSQFKLHKFGYEYTYRMAFIAYVYSCFLIISLVIVLTYIFKIFRDMKTKEGMLLSGANL